MTTAAYVIATSSYSGISFFIKSIVYCVLIKLTNEVNPVKAITIKG